METATAQAVMVPMKVEWQPAWLTWVGATTTCLKALGVNCDPADVAGTSGYAFTMSVHEALCPSGPTMFDWGSLLSGVNFLGRSTINYQSCDCYTGEFRNDRTRAHCRMAYEIAAKEISEGRPCVIWGAYVPEFAVAIGIEGGMQEGKYIVKSCRECSKEEQPPISWDGLDAPGGPYVLAFPTPTQFADRVGIDKQAVARAVRLLRSESAFPKYGFGLEAYDWWIKALETNTADAFGNAYNSQCYAEAKRYARDFLGKVASRNKKVAEPLSKAVEHYTGTVDAMSLLAKLFPFPPGEEVKDEKTRAKAVKALKRAKKSEKKAVEALEDALKMDWKE